MNQMRLCAAVAALALAAPVVANAAAAATPARPAASPAAAAAAAAPAPPNFAPPPGAPVPGVCIFSFEKTIGDSTVGKAYQARMQQLAAQVEAELNPERTSIQNDANALQTQRNTITPDQFTQRGNAINARIQAYQEKEQLRAQELDETKNRALQQIVNNINPLLVTVYTQRNCAVVVDQSTLIAANTAMDISPAVTAQLNTKMTTITFDRANLAQAAARP
jgi:outer membrane protein